MQTMLLTLDQWDLCLDAAGDWAVASEPYSIAQDVASAIKTFLGEVWYDTSVGVPYWQQILGKNPPLQVLKARLITAALTVPLVTSATCFIASNSDREIGGQVQVNYSIPATASSVVTQGQALITFVGSNGGVVTFVGSNGGVVTFSGSGF